MSVSASSASPSTNTTASVVTAVIANPAGPRLEIARAGTNIVLSWSTNGIGFYLQSKSSLAADGAWIFVANVPVIVGDRYYVTNAISGPATYYRLSNQMPQPSLGAILAGPTIILSWPTNAIGFSLQSTTNLSATSLWSVVSNAPVVVGENYFVTNSIGGDRRFYRLLK